MVLFRYNSINEVELIEFSNYNYFNISIVMSKEFSAFEEIVLEIGDV